jgi:hypothetical protein
MQQNGVALLYASEEFRADHEIALAAVPLNGTALRYASEELRADEVAIACSRMELHCCMPRRSSVPTARSLWRPFL